MVICKMPGQARLKKRQQRQKKTGLVMAMDKDSACFSVFQKSGKSWKGAEKKDEIWYSFMDVIAKNKEVSAEIKKICEIPELK